MRLQVLRHEDVEVGLVLDGAGERLAACRVAQQEAHPARVGPVFGVAGFEVRGYARSGGEDGAEGFGDGEGERVGDGVLARDAAALGAGAGAVEVERVEGLERFERFVGGIEL